MEQHHQLGAKYSPLQQIHAGNVAHLAPAWEYRSGDLPPADARMMFAFEDRPSLIDGNLEAVPTHCVTQGLGTISDARHIVLVATGRSKAEAVHHLVEGAVSAMWPATILQHHRHTTVLLDDAAARRLQLADYYRETYESKPDWQGI